MEIRHIAQRDGRLSSFLKQELGLSTGLMNRLKWAQKLYVNGVPHHADHPVSVGDEIVVILDDPAPQYPAEDGEISILYEDEHILCVDKPAGILIHPSRSVFTGTLANYVLGYYQKTNQSCAFHSVTRLDRDTFGVVLLAKNAHIHGLLNELHAQGKLQKTYEALVLGAPEPKEGMIDAPIARLPLPSLLRKVSAEGKPSVTEYGVTDEFDGYSKLSLRPITGRTHQLRVHCAYIGHPILGDPQYGNEASLEMSRKMEIKTQALCAKRLDFTHPITGNPFTATTRMMVK
jgi:23S rRNA pseudouridine1911/1915/1917 synthase